MVSPSGQLAAVNTVAVAVAEHTVAVAVAEGIVAVSVAEDTVAGCHQDKEH